MRPEGRSEEESPAPAGEVMQDGAESSSFGEG